MARFSNRTFSTMAACLAILLLVILLVVLWTGGWYGRVIGTNEKRIDLPNEVNANERRTNLSNDPVLFDKSINESSYTFLPSVKLHSTIFERVLANVTTITTTTTNEVPIVDKVERIKHNESLPDVFPSAKGDLEYIMPMKISQNQYEDPPDPSTSAKRHHSGHFRHATAKIWDPHPQYEFTAFGRFFRLRLAHDSSFISPDIKVTHISANTSRRVHPGHQLDCFYSGFVEGDPDSVVTVNLCHGMFFQIPDLTNDVVKREHIYMSVLSVGTVIFVLFIMCHVGQMVIDYSEDVIKEVCMIPFYDLSLKSQKLLLVTLMMNTKPFALWIGKFYVSSHEFFTNMLRTSLSFAMVIHSMKNV